MAENYVQGYRDSLVIPDKYNTGIQSGVELIPYAEYFAAYCNDGESLYITQALQNDLGTVYENVEFTQTVTINKANLVSMTFRNCKFSTSGSYGVNTGNNLDSENVIVTFENCEFLNQSSACVQPTKNFRLVNCKIHDMGSDGGKALINGSYENCYFYNIGSIDGAHADGIQVTGGADAIENFSIINCRFDTPTYTGYTVNAPIFFVLEGDCYNSVVKDCYAYGGNYSVYYGRKTPEDGVVIENNTVENIVVGPGYQYGMLNDNSNTVDPSEVKAAGKLFVSSVWKENNTIRLLATNYTNEEKTLKVVTDTETKSVIIPASPSFEDGKVYTNFSQFPFDVEVATTGNYVVCYDGNDQIRFVNFTGEDIPSGGGNNDTPNPPVIPSAPVIAHRLIEVNGHPARSDIKQFACVSVDDISGLPREGVRGTVEGLDPKDNDPCGIGSTAVVKTGEVFMLWPDNQWSQL